MKKSYHFRTLSIRYDRKYDIMGKVSNDWAHYHRRRICKTCIALPPPCKLLYISSNWNDSLEVKTAVILVIHSCGWRTVGAKWSFFLSLRTVLGPITHARERLRSGISIFGRAQRFAPTRTVSLKRLFCQHWGVQWPKLDPFGGGDLCSANFAIWREMSSASNGDRRWCISTFPICAWHLDLHKI